MSSLGNSTKHLKEDKEPIFTNSSKTGRGERTSQFIYEVGITLGPKPDRVGTRKLQTNIPCEYRQKDPQENTCKSNLAIYKKN